MALFTEQRLINRVDNEFRKSFSNIYETTFSKAKGFINESKNTQGLYFSKKYDIFLSHSSDDARLVAGLKLELEDLGYSVYVDWITDPELNRSKVTKNNAAVLKTRMNQCKVLLYAFSENAASSTWMPWELGYFDGIKGYVAVAPISKSSSSSFSGNEYLGLYPYIDIANVLDSNQQRLWVNESHNCYVEYNRWINGEKPTIR